MARTIKVRVYVIRNGARYKLLRFETPPTITASADALIHMSMAGTFLHDNSVDYINDQLQPVLIIDNAEHPLGLYVIGTLTRRESATRIEDEIEAYDKSLILQQTKIESRLHFPAGMLYTDCITKLLAMAGITRVDVQSGAASLQTDREDWEIGTDLLTITNQLLDEVNYRHIWFDFEGVAKAQPEKAASADNVTVMYTADKYSTLLADSTSKVDSYDAPNVFVVMVSNPDIGRPLTATAVNDSIDSPLSTVKRKRRIAKIIELDNTPTQAELQAYADMVCLQSMYTSEKVTFETAINANHQIGEIVALYGHMLSGVYTETGWNMNLAAGGVMHHTAERVAYKTGDVST